MKIVCLRLGSAGSTTPSSFLPELDIIAGTLPGPDFHLTVKPQESARGHSAVSAGPVGRAGLPTGPCKSAGGLSGRGVAGDQPQTCRGPGTGCSLDGAAEDTGDTGTGGSRAGSEG